MPTPGGAGLPTWPPSLGPTLCETIRTQKSKPGASFHLGGQPSPLSGGNRNWNSKENFLQKTIYVFPTFFPSACRLPGLLGTPTLP